MLCETRLPNKGLVELLLIKRWFLRTFKSLPISENVTKKVYYRIVLSVNDIKACLFQFLFV